MAINNPTTLVALKFSISDSPILFITNDATGSLTPVTLSSGTYTTFLANSGSGELEVYSEFNRKCGNYFLFSLNEDGRTKIQYRGTGAGSISFVSSNIARRMLGLSDSVVTLSFTSGSTVYSDYQPYGSIFSFGSTNDSSWQRTPSQTAYSKIPSGQVFGWKDGYNHYSRRMDFRFHPYSQSEKTLLSSNKATPVHQISKSLWGQPPNINTTAYVSPYTVDHFLDQAPGVEARASFAKLQQMIVGSESKYDIVYLDPETISKEEQYQQSIPNYHNLLDLNDVKFTLAGEGTRTFYTGSAVSAFTPSDISGLFAWYRSDDLTQASGTVSQVNDKTGNGRHAVQAVSGSQPLYFSSGGPNNKPYWAGEINTRYLLAGANNDFNLLHNGSNWTIIFIARGSNQGARVIFGTGNASSTDAAFTLFEGAAGYNGYAGSIGNGSGTVVTFNNPISLWTTGSFHKSIITYDNSLTTGAISSSIDTSTTYGTKTGTPTASNSGRKLGIGSAGSGVFITDTAWCEVIIYSKKLNSTELAKINSYILSRYGL